MRLKLIIIASVIAVTLAGCATYKSTMTNAKGETVTCEASGKSGFITGHYLRQGFEDYVSAAKIQGFREAPQVATKPE